MKQDNMAIGTGRLSN